MAPPTGPRMGQRPSGGTRGGSSGRGGGIQKRRAGTPRIDSDGDLVMNPAKSTTGAARGAGGAGGRGGRVLTRAAARKAVDNVMRALGSDGTSLAGRVPPHLKSRNQHTKILKIHGVKESKAASNPDGGEKGLLEFLERKANKDKTITIKKSVMAGDFVYIMVSIDDAPDILRLNEYSYAGAKLTITETHEPWPGKPGGGPVSEATQRSKDMLLGVLSRRYNPELKLLDLSALGQDETLVQGGFLGEKKTAEKAFKALLLIAEQQFPSAAVKNEAIRSVSLARNAIENIALVFDLADYFPEITAIDLSSNAIASLKGLGRWRYRFKHLETLMLVDNPIVTNEPNFHTEVMTWWPKLKFLNNQVVRTQEQIDAEVAQHRARPIPQNGSDFRDEGGIGEQFLTQFIPLYDADRAQLAALFYDDESCFSVSFATHTVREKNDLPVPPWTSYIRYSRNMSKITMEAARVQRLFKGSQSIAELWKSLPATKHPDLKSEISKYVVDCHPLNGLADPTGQVVGGVGGMAITMHGEFDEHDAATNQTGKRSFTRSLVIGPGKVAHQPIRVISDILALRAWSPAPDTTPPTDRSPEVLEQDLKRRRIADLSGRTGMTPAYTEMCLDQVGWNLDQALLLFETNKAGLPAEAWIRNNR